MRTLTTLLAAAAILCFMMPMTQAQTATTGQIVGVVTDPSGAIVVGAKVAVTSNAGVRRETKTGSNGRYTFPLLDPGAYHLEVNQSGFALLKLEGVVVQITETTVADAALRVAGAPTTVSVTGESPLVQTESAAKGTVIDETQVRDLPLPTRNFQQLLALTTGTSGPIQNSSELGRGDVPLYVNGQRSLSNSVVINGTDANSIGTGSSPNLAAPSIDSLQEFIVQTSMYDASQGRNAGGIVAVVTKSGTNNLHGDVFEFLRNTDLDANNYFLNAIGTPRPTYDRNQFGATLGGPVIKDRAWFFISYQGSRETNGTSLTNSLATEFVPAFLGSGPLSRTPELLAAFSTCYGLGGYVDPTAAAVLTAKLPNGQYMIPGIPGVTTGAGCTPGNPGEPVLQTIPSNSTYKEDQFNSNLDIKLNNANRFFGKFFFAANRTNQALYDQFGDGSPLQAPGWPTEEDVDQSILSLGVTSVISSRMLNEVRFGWSRIYGPGNPSQPITSSQLGIESPLSSLFPGMPTMSFTNMFTLGPSPLGINYAATDTKSIGDTMTWTKGAHTFKFGGEYKRQMLDAPYFDVFPNGEMFYLGFSAPTCPTSLGAGGQADCGVIKDFLSGLNGLSVIGSGTNSLHNRANDFSAFFQDDWKITRRLTLNLGLRYDYFGPTTETQGHFVGFIPSEATTVTVPGLGQVVTGGFVQAGNGNLPGFPKVGDGLVKPNYKNFGPRVGFSYQLGASGNKVLRGGYGIFYDRPNMRLFNSQLFNMPYEMLATALATPNENPFVQVPLPSAFPLTISGNPGVFPLGGYPAFLPVTLYPATSVAAYPVPATGLYPDLQDWSIPYIQTFNLGLQTSIANNWMLDVGYVGTEGRKYPRLFSFNQALPGLAGTYGLTPAQSGPFFPGFANLTAPGLGSFLMKSNSNSNYNSLQATLNKRFSHGLQMLLSYTWSHSLDYYSGSPVSDITLLPGDMVNEQHNYGSSDFDRRHRFVASYLYELPGAYHGSSAFGKEALNSWSVSGIVTLQSGAPFSIYGDDSAFESTVADLAPGRTLQSAIKSGNVKDRLNAYFDTSAFVIPAAIKDPGFGQLGRNIIVGPKQIETDLSIMKLFPVTERQHVEFRTEFFNLFNNVNWANPVNIVSSANFGQIATTTTGPRVIQFALKYNF
ncbi:MAG: carboxypeptidase regulatory-like domain-containing protein [Terriglobales bacterium]